MKRSDVLIVSRLAAAAVAAVPGLGIGLLALKEAFSRQVTLDLDQAFHLVLAVTLVLLAGSLVGLTLRAATAAGALALGVAGALLSVTGAVLSEVFGPLALMALLALTSALAARLLRSSLPKRVEHAQSS